MTNRAHISEHGPNKPRVNTSKHRGNLANNKKSGRPCSSRIQNNGCDVKKRLTAFFLQLISALSLPICRHLYLGARLSPPPESPISICGMPPYSPSPADGFAAFGDRLLFLVLFDRQVDQPDQHQQMNHRKQQEKFHLTIVEKKPDRTQYEHSKK